MKSIVYILFGGMISLFCAAAATSCDPRGAKRDAVARTGRVIAVSDSLLRADRADTIDLGRLTQGEVVAQELLIRNDGDSPFVIVGIESNCGCTTIDYYRQPVKPGESVPFSFRFDTGGFRGWQYKVIKIRTSLNNRAHRLIITADIE